MRCTFGLVCLVVGLGVIACTSDPDPVDTDVEDTEVPLPFPENADWADHPLWDPLAPGIFYVQIPALDWEEALWDIMPTEECAERPYLEGSVTFVDPTDGYEGVWRDVGVRWRGRSSLNGGPTTRVGLKLSFNELVPGRHFHGHKKINFMGTEGDHSYLREFFALGIARDLGIPAPRSAFAHLFVNGEYMGYYPITEEADDERYLLNTFGEAGGSLFKAKGYCGGPADFRDMGDDPLEYTPYDPRAGTPDSAIEQDLLPLIRCTTLRDDAEFKACVEPLIDLDEWLMEIAVDVILPDVDGLIGSGQNFMLYKRPDTGRFIVWPWDKDLALSDDNLDEGWTLAGAHPTWSADFRSRLGDRLVHVYADRYCAAAAEALDRYDPRVFAPEIRRQRDLMEPWMEADPFVDLELWHHRIGDMLDFTDFHHNDLVPRVEGCLIDRT